MTWEEKALAYRKDVGRATRDLDGKRVEAICTQLLADLQPDSQFPLEPARGILRDLRDLRFFELMERVARAFLRSGQGAFLVRCQLAQSLIDQDKLDEAIGGLDILIDDSVAAPVENAEARGLLGRAWKQRYVIKRGVEQVGAEEALREATRAYYLVYQSRANDREFLWHGINAVALLSDAQREGIVVAGYPDPRDLATNILRAIDELDLEQKAENWDFATAAEACVALDRPEDAMRWAERYARSDYTREFQLAGTLRQFREIWRLDGGRFRRLMMFLESELLRQGRGHQEIVLGMGNLAQEHGPVFVPLEAQPASSYDFERVFADGRLESISWFKLGLDRAEAVARIDDSIDHAVGTGFLIRGADLIRELGDTWLLMTNAHVISDDPATAGAQSGKPVLAELDAKVVFTLAKALQPPWTVKRILWSSLPNDLDCTLLCLNEPLPAVTRYFVAPALPTADGKQPVWVISHPGGRSMSFSARNNVLISTNGGRLQYRAATEGGSSGGPVFNNEWKLIGLHHAGEEVQRAAGPQDVPAGTKPYEVNEGISIFSILKKLGEPDVRNQILERAAEAGCIPTPPRRPA